MEDSDSASTTMKPSLRRVRRRCAHSGVPLRREFSAILQAMPCLGPGWSPLATCAEYNHFEPDSLPCRSTPTRSRLHCRCPAL